MAKTQEVGRLVTYIGSDVSGLLKGVTMGKLAVAGFATASALAIADFAESSFRSFAEFDEAMTRSTAIMGDLSEETHKAMADTARILSTQGLASAKDLAEGYFFLASAGFSAAESIEALGVVQKFAQAGAFDLATATDLLTDAQSALGMTSENAAENLAEMERLGNALVKANTLANASVSQFSTALTREAGSAMKNFGVEMEEGIALLAAYADQGIKAELAGTTLSRAMRMLIKASRDNRESFRQFGVEVFNAETGALQMTTAIRQLETAFEGMSTEQKVASLETLGFEARTQGAILPLLGAADAVEEYTEEIRDAGNVMEDVSRKQMDTMNSQLTTLSNNWNTLKQTIGELETGAVKDLVKLLGDAVNASRFLVENFDKVGEAFEQEFGAGLGALKGFLEATPIVALFDATEGIRDNAKDILSTLGNTQEVNDRIALQDAKRLAQQEELEKSQDRSNKKNNEALKQRVRETKALREEAERIAKAREESDQVMASRYGFDVGVLQRGREGGGHTLAGSIESFFGGVESGARDLAREQMRMAKKEERDRKAMMRKAESERKQAEDAARKAEELRLRNEKAIEAKDRFASAVEKGTVDAFSAEKRDSNSVQSQMLTESKKQTIIQERTLKASERGLNDRVSVAFFTGLQGA